jgi:alkylhydroperoxidase family enzyme
MLLPVEAPQPRPLDVHLASMEGDLAVGFPPAVRLPLATSRMARTTDCLHIVIHHLAKSLQAGSQAERLKARNDVR